MLFAQDFQTSVFDFLGFSYSFLLYSLGQLSSSLSNIPGRQSCACRHYFAPVHLLSLSEMQIGGRQRKFPVVLSERCAQRDEQVSAS